MSSRVGFALAVALLLLGAVLRMNQLATLPPGLNDEEITDILVVGSARAGDIEVFYNLGTEGREGLYHAVMAAVTSIIGRGLFSYHIIAVWASMLTLAMVYALTWRLFGPLAGVAALALLTTNMWMIMLGRGVGRETVVPLLVISIMLMLARGFVVYQRIHPRLPVNTVFAALGVLLGVGFYIHPSHFLIVLFSMVFIVYRLSSRQRLSAQTIGYLLFALLVMMIAAVPYLISSIRLPALSGASRVFDHYNITQTSPIQAVLTGISGIFFQGDQNPIHNIPGRPLLELISGLIVVAGVLVAARRWREARYGLPIIALVILIPSAFLIADGPNFLAYAPLLPILALFFGLGAHSLYQSLSAGPRRFAGLGIVCLLVFNLGWTGRDLFTVWPNLTAVTETYHSRLAQIAYYLDRDQNDAPVVLCDSRHPLHANDELSSTNLMLLMMNHKTLPIRFADCGTGLVLVNGGENQQVVMPDPNTLNMMPTYLHDWVVKGEILTSNDLPPNAVVNMHVANDLANTVGRFTTTSPAGYAPEAPGGAGLASPPIRFGGNLTFLGYEAPSPDPYQPGGVVSVITYWRVDGVVPPDLRLFTHILSDPAACCAAQNNAMSVSVSQLDNRDVFIQLTFVPLPYSIPDGMYNLSIGAYLTGTNERMVVMDGDQPRGNRLFLGQITVKKP